MFSRFAIYANVVGRTNYIQSRARIVRHAIIREVLVFQYGSNTSAKRLNGVDRLCGAARDCGLAETVEEYVLAFTHFSRKNRCGVADLVTNDRDRTRIYGVAYDVPNHRVVRSEASKSEKTLDDIEGEGLAYRRTTIKIILADGSVTNATTYLVLKPSQNVPTLPSYVSHIVNGLRAHHAPASYLYYVIHRAILSAPERAQAFTALLG